MDGSPLTDIGFQNLLLRAKGVEAHDAIVDSGSYYTLFGDWNAAEAMAYLLADFPGSPTYKRLAKGFQALPEELARLFTQAGGRLMLWMTNSEISPSGRSLKLGEGQCRTPSHHPVGLFKRIWIPAGNQRTQV